MVIFDMVIGMTEAAVLACVSLSSLFVGFGIGALVITWLHKGLYK
jgi:hypothetical protein